MIHRMDIPKHRFLSSYKKDITLTTVASEHSISCILSQDGHPIMYLSRRLSDTECNYSNIEKEALAIVWTTNRAHQFLGNKINGV